MGCVGEGASRHSNETYVRAPALDADYGVPIDAVCAETTPGVFSRRYTKATAKHDCHTGKSTIVRTA